MAGRSVGSISVDVDANTGRLTAQLRRAGEEGGRAMAQAIDSELADIGGPGFRRALARIRQQAEQAMQGIEAEITPEVDRADLLAARRRIERALSNIEADIDLQVDVRELVAERARIDAALEGIDVDIGATVDNSEVRVALGQIEALVAATDADVNIGADIDTSQFASALARLVSTGGGGGGAIGQAGQDIGQRIGQDITNSLLGTMGRAGPAIAGGIAALVQPAAVALTGALGGITALASSAFNAIIGGAGAAVPLVAGLGIEVGVLNIALSGMSDAIGGDIEALRDLSPEARDFAVAVRGLGDELDEVRRVVQQRLFAGLDDELTRLAETVLPAVTEGLGDAADSLNEFFRNLADVAAEADLEGIFEGIQPAVDDLLDAVVALARAIEPFLKAAAPAAQELASFIREGAEAFSEFVQTAADSGSLTDFLEGGVDSLKVWAELLVDVGDALFTLFRAGKETGDGFVQSLADIVEQFDQWIESVEGQEALSDFFALAKQIIEDMGPLMRGLVGFFDRIVTADAVERWGRLMNIVGDLLPPLGRFFDMIGRLADPAVRALEAIATVVSTLEGLFDKLPEPVQDFFEAMATGTLAIEIVAGIVENFGEVVETVIGPLESFVGLLGQIPGIGLLFGGVSGKAEEWFGGVGTEAEDAAGKVGRYGGEVAGLVPINSDLAASLRGTQTGLVGAAAEMSNAEAISRNLKGALEGQAAAIEAAASPINQAARGFEDLEAAASGAADAADRVKSIFDTFTDPATRAREAALEWEAGMDQLRQTVEDTGVSFDITTEAGQAFEESVAGQIQVIEDLAAANVQLGQSTGEVAVQSALRREALIQEQVALGATRGEAEALVNAYGLTPDSIATVFLQPGMTDAQMNALAYDGNLDGIPDSIATLISQPGMSQAMIDALLYDEDLDGIPDVVDTVIGQPGMPEAQTEATTYDGQIRGIPTGWNTLPFFDDAVANNEVTGYDGQIRGIPTGWNTLPFFDKEDAEGDAGVYEGRIRGIPTDWDTLFDVDNEAALDGIFAVQAAIAGIDTNVVVRVTTERRDLYLGSLGVQEGGGPFPHQVVAGEIRNQPELFQLGSGIGMVDRPTLLPRGVTVSPLTGPHSVLPAIRDLVEGAARGGPSKVINLTQNIQPQQADPVAVATSIINRAAAMAV